MSVYVNHASAPSGGGSGVPAGSVFWLASQTIPDGYLLCDGRTLNETDYPELFKSIGRIFGGTESNKTFNLPNLQASFIRGAGTQDGYSAEFGAKQQGTYLTFADSNIQNHNPSYPDKIGSSGYSTTAYKHQTTTITKPLSYYYFRPYNTALTPIIKT